MEAALSLVNVGQGTNYVRLTPPQTNELTGFSVGKGAYCFVIDVSGSMNAAAQITTDDGDKVNHGWSQLDIAKHSTNTFVASLSDGDYVSVVTYSDGANVRALRCSPSAIIFPHNVLLFCVRFEPAHSAALLAPIPPSQITRAHTSAPSPRARAIAQVLLDWTLCSEEGREKAIAAIHSMRPERSTNLMAGITTGFSQFDTFTEQANDALDKFNMQLIITTDGMPSSQWHPARGRDGYLPLVNALSKGLCKKRGEAARPVVTTIGIGYQLDSELLTNMSQTFLHMPDPGQIGPFIVNLLASCRSTARLPTKEGAAANNCTLVVTPAAALRQDIPAVPGYEARGVEITYDENGIECCEIYLGSVAYDQPRHVVLKTIESPGEFTVALKLNGATALSVSSAEAKAADAGTQKIAAVQELRLKACTTLVAASTAGAQDADAAALAAPIVELVKELRACAYASDPAVSALAKTLEDQAVMGCERTAFQKWGGHYFRTLPCMLKAERRSNFRDECLQHFGKDARMREGVFEEQSNLAEMKFATLKPPEPSLLRPQPAFGVPVGGGGAMPATASAPPRAPVALPDEFMRGGGCFGPNATVLRALPDGSAVRSAVSTIRAGDVLVCEDGRLAPVRCVVLTECLGGKAQLTRLPNGTHITEWHPLREPSSGRWRFPIMLGTQVLVTTPYVYNFVLAPGFPTILIDGLPCAALGHGLDAPVVAHPYWGTSAVISDLMGKPGWEAGRVVLPATHAAHA